MEKLSFFCTNLRRSLLFSLLLTGSAHSMQDISAQQLRDFIEQDKPQAVIEILQSETFDKKLLEDVDEIEETLLHKAVHKGYFDLVQSLLAAGSLVNAINMAGSTPYDLAVARSEAESEEGEKLINLLFELGGRSAKDLKSQEARVQVRVRSGEGLIGDVPPLILDGVSGDSDITPPPLNPDDVLRSAAEQKSPRGLVSPRRQPSAPDEPKKDGRRLSLVGNWLLKWGAPTGLATLATTLMAIVAAKKDAIIEYLSIPCEDINIDLGKKTKKSSTAT